MKTIGKILTTLMLGLFVMAIVVRCKPELDPKTGRPIEELYPVQKDTTLGDGNSITFYRFKQSGMKYLLLRYNEVAVINLTKDSLESEAYRRVLIGSQITSEKCDCEAGTCTKSCCAAKETSSNSH